MGTPTRTDGSGLHCPHCGVSATPEHNYCVHCGGDLSALRAVAETDHDPTADTHRRPHERQDTRQTSDGRSERETESDPFRKRVRYLVSNGWDVDYDAGDEVVLVDRGIGSVGVHVLLLLFTSGLGNLLYGWYHYSVAPERVMLRADGDGYEVVDPSDGATDTQAYADKTSSLSQFAGGLVLLLVGVVTIVTTAFSTLPLLLGGLLVFLSLFVMPPTRRRIRNRHPPTTFGPTESVEERCVTDTNRPCAVCGSRVEDGTVRDYEREQVLAGIPLYTMAAGENYYCGDCAGRSTGGEVTDDLAGFADVEGELQRLREQHGQRLDSSEEPTGPADRDRTEGPATERADDRERSSERISE